MKLVIQIPAWNEEEHLGRALEALPAAVEGFDEVEVLVIDDGSADAAASIARGEQLNLSTRKRRGPVLSFVSLGLRILEQYPRLLSINRRTLYAHAL